MKDSPIPKQQCPHCGYKMNRTGSAFTDDDPREGDITMCLNCGKWGFFDADFTIRKPTPEEQTKWAFHPQLLLAQMARIKIVGGRDLRETAKKLDSDKKGDRLN